MDVVSGGLEIDARIGGRFGPIVGRNVAVVMTLVESPHPLLMHIVLASEYRWAVGDL